MRMVGTVRTTYDDYLKANPDYKMVYADPIEADLTAAAFSMDTNFVPVEDEPEQPEAEPEQPEAEQPAEAEPEQPEQTAAPAEAETAPEADASAFTTEDYELVNSFEGREGSIIVWKSAEGRLDVKFNVAQAGRYAI